MLLAVYLVGTALGAAAYDRWLAARARRARCATDCCERWRRACCSASLSLASAERAQGVAAACARARAWRPRSPPKALLAIGAFLLPTIVMGALFSHLGTHARGSRHQLRPRARRQHAGRRARAAAVRRAAAARARHEVRAAARRRGLSRCSSSRRAWARRRSWAAAGAAVALALWAPSLAIVDVPEGGRVVQLRRRRDGDGQRGRGRARRRDACTSTTASRKAAARRCSPMRARRCCRSCCIPRRGARCSSGSAPASPRRRRPRIRRCRSTRSSCCPRSSRRRRTSRAVVRDARDPRLHLMTADARRFVRAAPRALRRDRLRQLPSRRAAAPARSTPSSISRPCASGSPPAACSASGCRCISSISTRCAASCAASSRVYPRGWAMLATNSLDTPVLGLVARRDGERFDARSRCASACAARECRAARRSSASPTISRCSAASSPVRAALARFAGDAPLNTDDHPVVAYRAPRITYAPDSPPRDRLIALLREVDIAPGRAASRRRTIPRGRPDSRRTGPRAIASSRRAATCGRRPTCGACWRRCASRCSRCCAISPDFRPAYDPLLRMAIGARSRSMLPQPARLLAELARVQPDRPEAAQAQRELAGTAP